MFVALRLFGDVLWHILYAPLWWYSVQLFHAWREARQFLADGNRELAPGLWLRHIFTPMFGQYDWQGRLISVGMRMVNIIVRTVLFFLWVSIVLIVWCVWMALPLVLLALIAHTLGYAEL